MCRKKFKKCWYLGQQCDLSKLHFLSKYFRAMCWYEGRSSSRRLGGWFASLFHNAVMQVWWPSVGLVWTMLRVWEVRSSVLEKNEDWKWKGSSLKCGFSGGLKFGFGGLQAQKVRCFTSWVRFHQVRNCRVRTTTRGCASAITIKREKDVPLQVRLIAKCQGDDSKLMYDKLCSMYILWNAQLWIRHNFFSQYVFEETKWAVWQVQQFSSLLAVLEYFCWNMYWGSQSWY